MARSLMAIVHMSTEQKPAEQKPEMVFLTVTWAADRTHFSLLHHSLQLSALRTVPHHVVVQHEDLELFRSFADERTQLHSSAEILPSDVELKRNKARAWQRRLGRSATRLAGSLARHVGWPDWVRYTGWHTQQLTKLAFVAASDVDTVVVMDSDVIVTPHASAADFIEPGKIVCYRHERPAQALRGKVLHWQQTASRLLDDPFSVGASFDGYYDTPFVMHAPSVRALLAWLEQRYAQPWWLTLVQQPPRHWSEFGIYKQFLRHHQEQPVDWRGAEIMGYLFDAHDIEGLSHRFADLIARQHAHCITIHSQSSGRQLWTADSYGSAIRGELEKAYGT
jgi:hypothetical protein